MSIKWTSFCKNSHISLLSIEQNNLKEIWEYFFRGKTSEDNNAKIKVFPDIPCTFLLFKASAFLQVFFPRNLLFQQVFTMSAFLNSKCLESLNKRTQIPLFIIQFVSLIELKMKRLINYWTNTCKFKIDKTTYSNW